RNSHDELVGEIEYALHTRSNGYKDFIYEIRKINDNIRLIVVGKDGYRFAKNSSVRDLMKNCDKDDEDRYIVKLQESSLYAEFLNESTEDFRQT
ncbi:hypothetical protein GGI21_004385, partial [Coemansia aciculifera]